MLQHVENTATADPVFAVWRKRSIRSQDNRTFSHKLNATWKGTEEMCRDKHRSIMTNESEIIESWKRQFDEH